MFLSHDVFVATCRRNPFGLIVVLNDTGNAEGDLFYDDGESIDTVGNQSFYYARFRWSSSERRLSMNVIANNYSGMSELVLDTISIYGLHEFPSTLNIDQKEYLPIRRAFTQIIDFQGLALPMNESHTLTWSNYQPMRVEAAEILVSSPKYRVDCFPDPSKLSFIGFRMSDEACLQIRPVTRASLVDACGILKRK